MSEGSYYIAKENDCVSSIAEEKGLFWETIWNDSNNKKLKELRKDPNVIHPGDTIFIPDIRKREEDVQTEQRHRFCRKGVPAKARFRFLDKGEPRANLPYKLTVDGKHYNGSTDGNGCIEVSISPKAIKGILTITDNGYEEVYELEFGHMDPVNEEPGALKRLRNLGYECDDKKKIKTTRMLIKY